MFFRVIFTYRHQCSLCQVSFRNPRFLAENSFPQIRNNSEIGELPRLCQPSVFFRIGDHGAQPSDSPDVWSFFLNKNNQPGEADRTSAKALSSYGNSTRSCLLRRLNIRCKAEILLVIGSFCSGSPRTHKQVPQMKKGKIDPGLSSVSSSTGRLSE